MYEVSSEFEGWEYLICPIAMENHIEYLTQINLEFNGAIDSFEEYEFSDKISKINTFFEYESIMLKNKFLILGPGSYFIVNKFSTKKYIEELDALNKRYCR